MGITGVNRYRSWCGGAIVILRPYSDPSLFTKGGQCELTQANFPFLVHAFVPTLTGLKRPDGITWGLSSNFKNLTDAIGDVVISTSTTFTIPATGQLRAAGTITKSSGNWGTLGTKNALVITTGSFSAATVEPFRIGSPASFGDPGISVAGDGGTTTRNMATFDASNYAEGIAFTAPSYPLFSEAVLVTNHPSGTGNGTLTTYGCNATANYATAAQTPTGDIAQTWPRYGNGTTDVGVTPQASSYITGIYVCHFTTTPSDIPAALQWMHTNPGKMYPSWKGLT